jgi:hypothetical protein
VIVWKGWGIVVPLIYLLLTTAVREGMTSVGAEDNPALAVGLVLSAILVWFVGRKLNNQDRAKRVIDIENGEEILLVSTHTLFWIKVEYWAFIVPIVVGAIVVANP